METTETILAQNTKAPVQTAASDNGNGMRYFTLSELGQAIESLQVLYGEHAVVPMTDGSHDESMQVPTENELLAFQEVLRQISGSMDSMISSLERIGENLHEAAEDLRTARLMSGAR